MNEVDRKFCRVRFTRERAMTIERNREKFSASRLATARGTFACLVRSREAKTGSIGAIAITPSDVVESLGPSGKALRLQRMELPAGLPGGIFSALCDMP